MSALSQEDLKAIEALHNDWIAMELAGSGSQVITLCTNDVMWIPPNSPPLEGKAAVNTYLNANRVCLKDVQIKDVEIRGSGAVAYLSSNYRSKFSIEGLSQNQEATGTHLWILQKSTDDVWRVALVAWSLW